jgi:HEPN domain-containing protein
MAADLPKNQVFVIAAYLDDVDLDLDAAKRLIAEPPNRLAAFHLQQAAEKLIKAVRLGHGLRVTAEHNLELLIGELPRDGPWRTKLVVLESLSSYATSLQISIAERRRKDAPSSDEVLVWIRTIAGLSAEARAAFVARA